MILRITAHHRASYDAQGALGRGQTEVRVTMRDGTVHVSAQFAARSILEPLTAAAVVEKFRHLTAGVIETDRQNRLIDVVTALERQPDLQELRALLGPVVTSPFEGNS